MRRALQQNITKLCQRSSKLGNIVERIFKPIIDGFYPRKTSTRNQNKCECMFLGLSFRQASELPKRQTLNEKSDEQSMSGRERERERVCSSVKVKSESMSQTE